MLCASVFRLTVPFGLFLFWAAPSTYAAEYDVCARGTGEKFTHTAHVQASIEGPELGQDANAALAPLVNRLVWQGRAEKVFIEAYDETLCSASLGNRQEIILSITQPEADQIKAELGRGPAVESGTMALLGERATVGADLASTSSEGKHPYFTLRIYYATNRNDTGKPDPKERFGSDRGQSISLGSVDVTIPKDHRMGELETPSIFKLQFYEDPEKHITLPSLHPLDHGAWSKELQTRAMALRRPAVLLFIHGYNVGFRDAGIRRGQLAYDLASPSPAVFFSWPSRGHVVPYTADEQAAEWSIPMMKEILAVLTNLGPGVPIYVIAHSMGNRVLTRAFKDLLDEDLTKRRSFREIVLTAPDLDAAVFKMQLAPAILGRGAGFTLYASSHDLALVGSRKFHGEYRRLGESGPELTVLPDINSVDASNVKTDFLGHSYFGDSSTVMADLFYLIRQRLKPQERFALEPVPFTMGNYWQFKR